MHMHMQSSWIPRPFFNSTLLSSCGNAFFFSRRCVKKKGYGIDRGEQISVPQLRSPFVSAVFVLLPLFFIFPKVVIFV
jgi:hypothetical protein